MNREWSFEIPDDGKVFPQHFIEAVWSYLQWTGLLTNPKPSSKEHLTDFILEAFQASLALEEGRQVSFSVYFCTCPESLTVKFSKPLPYAANQLIKLSPTVAGSSRLFRVSRPSESAAKLQIDGFYDPDILPVNRAHQRWGNGLVAFQPPVQGLKLSVLGPGWLRVSAGPIQNFELRNCCFREPVRIAQIKYVENCFSEITRNLSIADLAVGAGLSRRFIVNTIAKISAARHGGCLLVLPVAADINAVGVRIKYRTDTDKVQVVIKERSMVGPKVVAKEITGKEGPVEIEHDDSTLVDSLLLDRDLEHVTDLIAGFASVDGAVVIGRDLKVFGFGAEIVNASVVSDEELVEFGNHPKPLGKPADVPLTSLGMRHRSAYRFCRNVLGAMAFVVSQDGGIRLFCNVDGKVLQFIDLSAEEW